MLISQCVAILRKYDRIVSCIAMFTLSSLVENKVQYCTVYCNVQIIVQIVYLIFKCLENSKVKHVPCIAILRA